MTIDCMDTPTKIVYVAPMGSVTWASEQRTRWIEEVAHPATVHVIEPETDSHVSCHSINGGHGCGLRDLGGGGRRAGDC